MDNPLLYLDSGSARRKNVGEIVAPTNPLREPPSPPLPRPCGCQVPGGGGLPAMWAQKMPNSPKLSYNGHYYTVKSFYDDRPIKVNYHEETSRLLHTKCAVRISKGIELFSDWSKNPIRISRILEYCNAIG